MPPVEMKRYKVDVVIEFDREHSTEAEAIEWASRIKRNLYQNLSPSFPEGVKVETSVWGFAIDGEDA